MRIVLILLFTAALNTISGQEFARLIDEDFSDWPESEILYKDVHNDINSGGIDLRNFSAKADDNFFYMVIEFGSEVNIQDDNNIALFIDADNNSSTGFSIDGIGAELKYVFGERRGTFFKNSGNSDVRQNNIGLVSSPTVTSDKFEISVKRDSEIDGEDVFTSNSIKILLKDESGIDKLPDESGGVAVDLTPEKNYDLQNFSISPPDDNSFRIVSYNVRRDDLFQSGNDEQFGRILKALNPDIIGFQEIYNHSDIETANKIKELIPDSDEYYSSKADPDIILLSKYPILEKFQIDGNGAFLLDMAPGYDSKLLLINAHTPCCDNDDGRQEEIDAIMNFVRDAKTPGGKIDIQEKTPIVILGDMNLVRKSEQLTTLLTGDIKNEGRFGEDFHPDWDESDFGDLKPFTTYQPNTFTWYSPNSSYSPGRLDFMIYTDSVIEPVNKFSLFTSALPADTLQKYGLQANDSFASDHIPITGDFIFKVPTSNKEKSPEKFGFQLQQNYPNPFNPSTVIQYTIPQAVDALSPSAKASAAAGLSADNAGPAEVLVSLKIYDQLGQNVATLLDEQKQPGSYEIVFDASRLSSGIYYYQLRSGDYMNVKKMVCLK